MMDQIGIILVLRVLILNHRYDDPIDGVTFELDYPMMLPASLPATPFDLEADIELGLEQLRNSPVDIQPPALSAVTIQSRDNSQERFIKR